MACIHINGLKLSFISGYEEAALKTQRSLAILNFGQTLVFSTALSTAMVLASNGIMNGQMTVGDLVKPFYRFSQIWVELLLLYII